MPAPESTPTAVETEVLSLVSAEDLAKLSPEKQTSAVMNRTAAPETISSR
jgi:hypothetical protein